jgi:hypothetical protein
VALLLAFASTHHRISPAPPEKMKVDLDEHERRYSGSSPVEVCLTRNQYDTDLPKEKRIFVPSLPSIQREARLLDCEQLKTLPARHRFLLDAIATPNV